MNQLYRLLHKLIHNSAGQARFVMALVGLSVAIVLLLMAVQLQVNYYQLLNGKNNQDSVANFLVLNKELTNQTVGASSLSEKEIANIKSQPFFESVGSLTPSRFKASIQSNSERFPFYTDIAFESVPAEFIDINNKDWQWDESATFLPIIVPNQFLDFYNFQFSFSQNLPQLTPQVVKMVVFKVTIQGNGTSYEMKGRVVGLSNRISSMMVPQNFMDWANKHFAPKDGNNKPSRVVVRTKDPGNPELKKYLQLNGLITDAEKTRFSRYRQIVGYVVNISAITGVLLLAFALLIFTLFIQLTIASCKDEIQLLVVLGASPKQLRIFLMKRFFPPNIIIVGIAFIAIGIGQFFLGNWLAQKQIFIGSFPSFYTLFTALLLLLVIAIVNFKTITNYLNQQVSSN